MKFPIRIAAAVLSLLTFGAVTMPSSADALPGSYRLKGATVAPEKGIFSGATVYHHNPDNGWHPAIVIICQADGSKHYLNPGDHSTAFCGDVGKVFVPAHAQIVYHTAAGGWHVWVDNNNDHGYYKAVMNGTTADWAVKRS